MKHVLVMVAVDKSPGNTADEWEPTRTIVSAELDNYNVGKEFGGWKVDGVNTVHLDVETLASLVDDANLSGEDTVKLLGEITGRSVQRALAKFGDGLVQAGEELRDAAP